MRQTSMTVNNITLYLTDIALPSVPLLPPFEPILYKPMCYLTGNPAEVGGFTLYASVYVPLSSIAIDFKFAHINAMNYLAVQVTTGDSSLGLFKLLYMKFVGLNQPVGFKLSSIDLTITDQPITASDGNVYWPVEGQGRTAIDYEDADESA
jgi:hypothetical protein